MERASELISSKSTPIVLTTFLCSKASISVSFPFKMLPRQRNGGESFSHFLPRELLRGSMSSCVEKLRGWLRLRCRWHGKLVERETANDGGEKQHAAPLVAKRGSHLVRATFDLPKESFDHILGANRLPVLFGERIESQAGIEIALQALDGRRINGLIFLDKSSDCLTSFCSA